jgi:hypothetical protein
MVGGLKEGKVAQRLLRRFQGELGAQRGHRAVPIAQGRDASRSASSLASRVPITTRKRRWGCLNKFPLVCRFRRTLTLGDGRTTYSFPLGEKARNATAAGTAAAAVAPTGPEDLASAAARRRAATLSAHRRPRAALGQAFDELV